MLLDCAHCGLVDWGQNVDATDRPCCPHCGAQISTRIDDSALEDEDWS